MAILEQEIVDVQGGFKKVINAGAEQLMFSILQQHQYAFPIKSTIREITSNGLDSITEKRIAREILSGAAKVEDYYVNLEGEIYENSKFDPSYYNLQYLSPIDEVHITYIDGGEVGKDKVVIQDYGVGLGASRLEGYFDLGYSSKRLLSKALGKFGIGAKSPLSVGVPFYTIRSRWNGREFIFNVYSHRVESLVPAFDLDTNTANVEYQFSNGYKCYYKQTTEANGLTIEIAAKKHHKQQYIDAVKQQLLYFNNVRLFIEENGYRREESIRANIIYEDDKIIMSSNSGYSKPHLLLNGVNYGFINFQELELDEKLGNIGIKVNPDLVSINPSRESLIWDDKTRETITTRFKEVVSIAEDIINKELKETDFLKWLKLAADIHAAGKFWNDKSENTPLGRLAKIVDLKNVELSYPVNPKYKFAFGIFNGFRIHKVGVTLERKGSKNVKTVTYSGNWIDALQDGLPMYLASDDMKNRKNKYLMSLHPQGFILLRPDVFPHEDGTLITPDEIPTLRVDQVLEGYAKKFDEETRKRVAQRLADVHNFIWQSTRDNVIDYDNVVVPQEFKGSEEEIEEEEDEKTEESRISAEERRKLTGSIILHTPRIEDWNYHRKNEKVYAMQKLEMPVHIADIWNNEEIFWTNQDTEPLLHTAALITRVHSQTSKSVKSWTDVQKIQQEMTDLGYGRIFNSLDVQNFSNFFDDSPVRLIRVSQQNVKHFRDFKHITKFFKEIKNKTITMSNALVRWNTARLMKARIDELQFLKGFAGIDPQRHAKYLEVRDYVNKWWREITFGTKTLGADDTTTGQLIAHLDKVTEFQLFVRSHPDEPEAIAQLAQELFNPQPGVEIQDGRSIDTTLYDIFTELLDWAQPVQIMLNMVYPLINSDSISEEQENEIRNYFRYRNCPLN